ncbi:MAG: rsmE [Acidimicrobiales bacterium]|nr:rsmE [Acidimicrobiales bacterium]
MTDVGPRLVPSDGGPLVFVADLDRPVLDDADLHHLSRALRLRGGDPLVVSDGAGGWRPARFAGAHPEPTDQRQVAPRSAPAVEVAFALVKGTKPELAVQKLTELGVDRIRPFVAARSVVRWDAARSEHALARLRRVGREAAMQSRRAWLPEIDPVTTFAEVAADPRACRADRGGPPPTLDRPLILTGPEGGWDPTEQAADLPVVALGEGVLRAETAAITAGVLLTSLRAGLVRPA